MIDRNEIPTVHFYGEDGESSSLDLLHCEALITRSQEHHFKIRPHRHHELIQLFHLRQGQCKATLDGNIVLVKAPALLVIAAMCVHDFQWTPEVEGTVVSISTPLLENLGQEMHKEELAIESTRVIQLDQGSTQLDTLLQLLMQEYLSPTEDSRSHALYATVKLLAIWLERNVGKQADSSAPNTRQAQYFSHFTQLINRDYALHRSVESYADELGITAHYLNNLCQQLVKKNALQLIHERLLLEAKRYLVYSAQNISEVAYQLGFVDPAYFTRFFKRLTGQSPKAFKNSAQD